MTAAIPIPRTVQLTATQRDRAAAALLGSACADALGAPFEFGPAGSYRRQFPRPATDGGTEMLGGGVFGWAPGEFTDDTQMAVALAESLIEHGGFDPHDIWHRWRTWHLGAADVGITTGAALSHRRWNDAAAAVHRAQGRTAGNGALMRATPVGLATAAADPATATELTMRLAFEQGRLTHHDPAAGWGAAVHAELVRRSVLGADPIDEVADVVAVLPPDVRHGFAPVLRARWHPRDRTAPTNGTVWGCLAQAVWAIRTHPVFHDAVAAAIDLGGDTDTVACVAGALAGARAGTAGIPTRWLDLVHGRVLTADGERRYDGAAITDLAHRLTDPRSGPR